MTACIHVNQIILLLPACHTKQIFYDILFSMNEKIN